MSNYHLGVPHIGEEEKREVVKALDKGMLTCGEYLTKFPDLLSKIINQEVIVCSSGTAALHLGLHALGIGKGDEVIVPNISFISTINAVLYTGATPVICDVGDSSYEVSIDPYIVKSCLTSRTKAIIVANLFGGAGDLHQLKKIADNNDIALVEDAAQSLGSVYHLNAIGTIGTFGIYSFNGNKTVTAGGGGAISSSDSFFLRRINLLLNQAKDSFNPFSHTEIGFNYRLSNIHAAIGYAQLKKLKIFMDKKRAIHKEYSKKLDMLSYQYDSNCWLNVCKLKNVKAIDVYNHFKEIDIETRLLYAPFHTIGYLKKYAKGLYPVSERLYNSLICLPSDIGMSLDSISLIVKEIKLLESFHEEAHFFDV